MRPNRLARVNVNEALRSPQRKQLLLRMPKEQRLRGIGLVLRTLWDQSMPSPRKSQRATSRRMKFERNRMARRETQHRQAQLKRDQLWIAKHQAWVRRMIRAGRLRPINV